MLETIFGTIFDSSDTTSITVANFLLCLAVAFVSGLCIAATAYYKGRTTKSFFVCLTLLPALVGAVIMMVNGNLGAGVAVAGAFSLIRFRSAPGTAREIVIIFLAMCAGLMIGMGYLAFAALLTVIVCAIILVLQVVISRKGSENPDRTLRITIPEDLDYTNVFNDIFENYAVSYRLLSAKTTNLGSMFRLTYEIKLKSGVNEKMFVDELRCRNGNLEIMVGVREDASDEL